MEGGSGSPTPPVWPMESSGPGANVGGRRRPGLRPGCWSVQSAQSKDVDVVRLVGVGGRVGGQTFAVEGKISRAAGYIKSSLLRVIGDPVVGIGDHHILLINRRARRDIVDEHVLTRRRVCRRQPPVRQRNAGCELYHRRRGPEGVALGAIRVINPVEPTGQNKQCVPIRAHHARDRMPRRPWVTVDQPGSGQRLERGAFGPPVAQSIGSCWA